MPVMTAMLRHGKILETFSAAERVVRIACLEARVVLRIAGLHLGVGKASKMP